MQNIHNGTTIVSNVTQLATSRKRFQRTGKSTIRYQGKMQIFFKILYTVVSIVTKYHHKTDNVKQYGEVDENSFFKVQYRRSQHTILMEYVTKISKTKG